MRDISGKQITLRTATGIGMVTCSASTVDHIKNDTLPKGNMFDVARAAAFLAAKKYITAYSALPPGGYRWHVC